MRTPTRCTPVSPLFTCHQLFYADPTLRYLWVTSFVKFKGSASQTMFVLFFASIAQCTPVSSVFTCVWKGTHKAHNCGQKHSMIIGPALLSYLVYNLLKTGENRWNRCTLGEVGIDQFQRNIVCNTEPLKLKTVVTYVYLTVWYVKNL